MGIAVSDPIFANRIASALSRLGIPYCFLGRGLPPRNVVAVLDDSVLGQGPMRVARRLLLRLRGLVGSPIVVGVDPGPKPGIAVVSGGQLLESMEVPSVEGAIAEILGILGDYGSETVVRVGDGDEPNRNPLVNGLLSRGVRVELVSERVTKGCRSNEEAAEAIARSRGVPVRGRLETRVTPGLIREIQRRSRIESGGRVTIDRDLAIEVLKGKLTLREAIEKVEGR